MKKILLTGAPGWLGSRFVDLWREKVALHGFADATLRCVVLPGARTDVMDALGAEIVPGDLRDPSVAARAVEGVDAVVHGAGLIHARRVADYDALNVEGTRTLATAALRAGVRRFVLISSNSAQGFNTRPDRLMTEDGPCNPESPYGRSKQAAELIVRGLDGEEGMRTVVLRPCLYYGVRQPERFLRLIRMVKNGRAIVFGHGHNLRSMTFVDDVVSASWLGLTHDAAPGGTFWIADRRPYTTLEILESIARVIDVRLRYLRVPALVARGVEVADVAWSALGQYQMDLHVVGESIRDIGCDPSLACSTLGFSPRDDLEGGLRTAIEWSRAHGEL